MRLEEALAPGVIVLLDDDTLAEVTRLWKDSRGHIVEVKPLLSGPRISVRTSSIDRPYARPTDANVSCGICLDAPAEYELADGSLVCRECLA